MPSSLCLVSNLHVVIMQPGIKYDQAGEVQSAVTKEEVMNQNLKKQIEVTSESGVEQVSHMGKWIWPLTCILDFAWQQQSCGIA